MTSESTRAYQSLKSLSKVNRLQPLKVLKRLTFNGYLTWSAAQEEWIILLSHGDIVYATGGRCRAERYRRYLQQDETFAIALNTLTAADTEGNALLQVALQEYTLMATWVEQRKLSKADYQVFLQRLLAEILFDVVQAETVSHQLHRHDAIALKPAPISLESDQVISGIRDDWQNWIDAGLAQVWPNLAPTIQQPEAMRAAVSPQTFRGLRLMLDGRHSLRQLSVKMQRSSLQFAQALRPYLEAGWLTLVEPPISAANTLASPSNPALVQRTPLIACIDDSQMICHSMAQVVKAAGYDFVSVTEPARAMKTLLTRRPDLIFLDLIMPDTNGYELCEQLRKISLFKETPIVILSGNDGLVDQVRARLLGATDFLSKPIEPVVILTIIKRHLAALPV